MLKDRRVTKSLGLEIAEEPVRRWHQPRNEWHRDPPVVCDSTDDTDDEGDFAPTPKNKVSHRRRPSKNLRARKSLWSSPQVWLDFALEFLKAIVDASETTSRAHYRSVVSATRHSVREDQGMLLLAGLTVAAGLFGAGLSGVTITVFLHRGITHGSIRMSRPAYEIGRWMAWFTTFIRHWEWRRIHRKHHLYTDIWIDEIRHDPHSPIQIARTRAINGFRRVAWHMATIFHTEAKLPESRFHLRTSWRSAARPARPRALRPTSRRSDAHRRDLHRRSSRFCAGIIGLNRSVGVEFACVVAGVLALGIHISVMLRFGGAINSDCHKGKVETPVPATR